MGCNTSKSVVLLEGNRNSVTDVKKTKTEDVENKEQQENSVKPEIDNSNVKNQDDNSKKCMTGDGNKENQVAKEEANNDKKLQESEKDIKNDKQHSNTSESQLTDQKVETESVDKNNEPKENMNIQKNTEIGQSSCIKETELDVKENIVDNETGENKACGTQDQNKPAHVDTLVLKNSGDDIDNEEYVTDSEICLDLEEYVNIPMSQLKLTGAAPDWTGTAVVEGEFTELRLTDFKGKYLVFFFYPLDFTFVCPTEIIAFSDRVEEFKSVGCEVVACSTDSHFSHLAWVNTPRKQGGLGHMKIPLLADKNCEIARKYGVYKEDDGIAFRGLFIIDDKGNLRQITINDLPVGRSVDETLRLVQAFQFTDRHGEVCPAGWKPGADTMKPDPTNSKKYFEKKN